MYKNVELWLNSLIGKSFLRDSLAEKKKRSVRNKKRDGEKNKQKSKDRKVL